MVGLSWIKRSLSIWSSIQFLSKISCDHFGAQLIYKLFYKSQIRIDQFLAGVGGQTGYLRGKEASSWPGPGLAQVRSWLKSTKNRPIFDPILTDFQKSTKFLIKNQPKNESILTHFWLKINPKIRLNLKISQVLVL